MPFRRRCAEGQKRLPASAISVMILTRVQPVSTAARTPVRSESVASKSSSRFSPMEVRLEKDGHISAKACRWVQVAQQMDSVPELVHRIFHSVRACHRRLRVECNAPSRSPRERLWTRLRDRRSRSSGTRSFTQPSTTHSSLPMARTLLGISPNTCVRRGAVSAPRTHAHGLFRSDRHPHVVALGPEHLGGRQRSSGNPNPEMDPYGSDFGTDGRNTLRPRSGTDRCNPTALRKTYRQL